MLTPLSGLTSQIAVSQPVRSSSGAASPGEPIDSVAQFMGSLSENDLRYTPGLQSLGLDLQQHGQPDPTREGAILEALNCNGDRHLRVHIARMIVANPEFGESHAAALKSLIAGCSSLPVHEQPKMWEDVGCDLAAQRGLTAPQANLIQQAFGQGMAPLDALSIARAVLKTSPDEARLESAALLLPAFVKGDPHWSRVALDRLLEKTLSPAQQQATRGLMRSMQLKETSHSAFCLIDDITGKTLSQAQGTVLEALGTELDKSSSSFVPGLCRNAMERPIPDENVESIVELCAQRDWNAIDALLSGPSAPRSRGGRPSGLELEPDQSQSDAAGAKSEEILPAGAPGGPKGEPDSASELSEPQTQARPEVESTPVGTLRETSSGVMVNGILLRRRTRH